MAITELNSATEAQAKQLLRQCCTSQRWIDRLVAQRPFENLEALKRAADEVWAGLGEADFLEAFDGHPKIGDVQSLKAKYADTKKLAAGEQSSMSVASDAEIAALAEGNATYEARFGFIFIVCATGKSPGQMLALLEQRLPNSRHQELSIAAEEQRKIFQLRLEKLT